MEPTCQYYFFLFHPNNPNPKRNHQIFSSRAKKRSRQSQTCAKYRGVIFCIRRKTDVNKSDLKILIWFLSSRNSLSVTHSDTALYVKIEIFKNSGFSQGFTKVVKKYRFKCHKWDFHHKRWIWKYLFNKTYWLAKIESLG